MMKFLDKLIPKIFRNVNYSKEVGKPSMQIHAAVGKDQLWGNFFADIVMANTDYILRTRASGKSYDFYTEMEEKDPNLHGNVRTRKKAVTGLAWDILPHVSRSGGEPKRKDKKIADECKAIFEQVSNLHQDQFELLDGIAKGFAVSEILWSVNGYVGIEALKSRKQRRFVFDKDHNLKLVTDKEPLIGKIMPDRKFLVLRNEPYAENPYGNAVLKYCYWYWWFKKNSVKWWAIFQEKFGSPHLDVETENELQGGEKERIDNFMANYQNETAIRHTKGIAIKFLEASRKGQAGYEKFLSYCDDQNAIAVLGQTLTSSEGQRSGSLALGRVHADVRQDILEDDAKNLDAVMNQLLKWIVDYNWANVEGYPKYVTDSTPPQDLKGLAERDKILFKEIGVPISKKYFYDKYSIPEPQEDEDLLAIPVGSPFPPAMSEVQFADRRRKYVQIGNTMSLQDKLRKRLEEIYKKLEPFYLELMGANIPLKTAVDQMVRNHFDKLMRTEFNGATREAVVVGVQSIADQFGLKVTRGEYLKWVDDYLKFRIYEKGKFDKIGSTLSELLHNKAKALYDQKLTVGAIKNQLKDKFKDMADWKANLIAKTEINEAANYGGIQMMKHSGLRVKAWFYVDPASCDQCQDWASRNPYTIHQAEGMGLPHPNCDDQWAFTVEE